MYSVTTDPYEVSKFHMEIKYIKDRRGWFSDDDAIRFQKLHDRFSKGELRAEDVAELKQWFAALRAQERAVYDAAIPRNRG